MRFIAVLDDCNDSKEAGNDQMQEEGEGERKRRRREEEREKGFKGEGREGEIKKERKKERKKKERKEGRERGKEKRETKGEGREEEREEERKGGRALLASAVHVARAPYMNVTQDVAVGLSCILCTPTLDYPEYHAHLRPICSIFYENSK